MENANVEDLSFEEALAQLEQLVEKIDAGELPLAEAIDTFRLAMALSEHCSGLLQEAEAAIEELVADTEQGTRPTKEEDDPFGDQ